MSNSMICPSCVCGCLILPYSCLYDRDSRLKKMDLQEKPEILNAVNTFILIGGEAFGLLGESCFNQLCSSIKQAEALAGAWREVNPSEDSEEGEFWYYMPANWLAMIRSTHFQNMYAAYCIYYYHILGISSSETTLDGDVVNKRNGGTNNSGQGSENINTKDSDKKAMNHLSIAKGYLNVFKREFLFKYYKNYPCLVTRGCCGCYYEMDCGCGGKAGTVGACDQKQRIPRKPRSVAL